MSSPRTLTAKQARRIALGAQGFADPLPAGAVDARHVKRVLERVKLLQIDSVNVLVRSSLPAALLSAGGLSDDAARSLEPRPQAPPLRVLGARGLVDTAGAASAVPLAHGGGQARRRSLCQPLPLRQRKGRSSSTGSCTASARTGRSSLARPAASAAAAGWWGWSETKHALEYLFWTGQVDRLRAAQDLRAPSTTCPSALCPPRSSHCRRRPRKTPSAGC